MSNPDEELDLFSFAEAQEAEKTAEESAAAPAVPAAGAEETPPAADPESGLTFPARVPPPKALTRSDFQQLCVGFLASLAPHAVATSVPVRRFKYKVNAAGFWRGENARSKDVVKPPSWFSSIRWTTVSANASTSRPCSAKSTRCAAKRSGSKPKSGRTSRNSLRPTISSANCGAGIMRRAGIRHTASSAPGSKTPAHAASGQPPRTHPPGRGRRSLLSGRSDRTHRAG
ncbi:MAG: hypothetical protein V8T86_14920 [Victivallis sp.]